MRSNKNKSYCGKGSAPGNDKKYLKCSICDVSIIFKIGALHGDNVIIAAITSLGRLYFFSDGSYFAPDNSGTAF